MTDDATLTYMKASYIEGDKPSRDDAPELIDEIKRLRSALSRFTEGKPSDRQLNELADFAYDFDVETSTIQWLNRIAQGEVGK